jgi:hypothetical protein
MKRLLSAIAILCTLLMIIIGITQNHSSTEQASPLITVMQEFHIADGRWCWRGLCLDQLRLHEASLRMRDKAVFGDLANIKDQSSAVTWEWLDRPEWYGLLARPRNGEWVSRFNFRMGDNQLTLADALTLFGTPQTLYIEVTSIVTVQICFEHDVCVWVVQRNGLVTPAEPITGIDFMTPEAFQAQMVYGVEVIKWHGFANYTPRWYRLINRACA